MASRPLAASLTGPADAPVLVLGDSLGTSRAVWDAQASALEQNFRLLRYELPGHGGSAAWPGNSYELADLGAGVLGVLNSYGIERASYCGVSIGGMIGMWLAAHAPDRIAALGLVCTSAFLPPAEGWRARAAQVLAAGPASISAAVLGRWFTPAYAAAHPAVIAAFRAEFERTDPAGYAGCCHAIAGLDLRPDLASIAAPTLVIAGADDPATPAAHGEAIAAGIGGARLLVVPDAAHLAPVSAPDIVTPALADHLLAQARDQ
ncbi:MAG TPA: 3-oxoadipate enol-lactonase [Streptosporangiaceae bacterium]|jgi:3-oxoadipate enol-lactonase